MDRSPEPFPLIDAQGRPRERGRAHGEAARQRVRLSAEHYEAQLGTLGLAPADADELTAGFLPGLEAFAPDLVEEMRGIAEGAGLPLARIALINARTEVLQLARRRTQTVEDDPDGCTGAVVLPEASATGQVIHGQNWDWKAECLETAIVLRILRDDGPDILTFTEAGGLAPKRLELGRNRDHRQLPRMRPRLRLDRRAAAVHPGGACSRLRTTRWRCGWWSPRRSRAPTT